MTKSDPSPAAAPTEGDEKPAGRTGEGFASIVAELAVQQRRVDHLVNRIGLPDLEPDPDPEAS
ncbi:MAG TPA: hypothetical protein VGE20_04200 [Ramlibacter sp.]